MTKLSCANSPENGVFGPMLCTLGGCRESRVSDTHAINAHLHFVVLRPSSKYSRGIVLVALGEDAKVVDKRLKTEHHPLHPC